MNPQTSRKREAPGQPLMNLVPHVREKPPDNHYLEKLRQRRAQLPGA